jgi:hypothetical protein
VAAEVGTLVLEDEPEFIGRQAAGDSGGQEEPGAEKAYQCRAAGCRCQEHGHLSADSHGVAGILKDGKHIAVVCGDRVAQCCAKSE